MGKVFFTADLHFGHENVIKFDARPFETVEEMDEELIRRWNEKVGKGDLVYVLGDMIWKTRNSDAETLIKRLNGQIILIKGNHDRFLHNAKAKNALAGVKDYDDICVKLEDGSERRVILFHQYIPFYIGHRHEAIHLFGHSHTTDEHTEEELIKRRLKYKGYSQRCYNVGCMHWKYEPVTLDEILAQTSMEEEEEAKAKSKAMSECRHKSMWMGTRYPPLDWKEYKASMSTIDPEFGKRLKEIHVNESPNHEYELTDSHDRYFQMRLFALGNYACVWQLYYYGLSRGQILIHQRLRQNLSPYECAEKIGISVDEYVAYEKDEADLREVKAKTLIAIAKVLHTEADELIEDYRR